MHFAEVPAVIDVFRLVIGFGIVGVGNLFLGVLIGRRMAPSHHHSHVRLEELMVAQSQRLIDEMHTVETKLDGFVAIINNSNTFMGELITALAEFKDQPTPEAVSGAIDSLETHLVGVGDAIKRLADRQLPAASSPQQSTSPEQPTVQASAGPDTTQAAPAIEDPTKG